jgi:hypothetical protein
MFRFCKREKHSNKTRITLIDTLILINKELSTFTLRVTRCIWQCMKAIVAKSECVLDDLTPDIFEMAENFGEKSKDRTEFTSPMDMSYITEIQEKDNI